MEPFLFLLIAGLIAAGKWILENHGSRGSREKERNFPAGRRTAPSSRTTPAGSPEEERMRRFMEALGLPNDAAPPQKAGTPRPAPAGRQPQPTHRPRPATVNRPLPMPPMEEVPPLLRKEPPPSRTVLSEPSPWRELNPEPAQPPVAPPLPKPPASVPAPATPSPAPLPSKAPAMAKPAPLPKPRPPMPYKPIQSAASLLPAERSIPPAETVWGKNSGKEAGINVERLQQNLRSAQSLREAFVLTEVLGPPAGLK